MQGPSQVSPFMIQGCRHLARQPGVATTPPRLRQQNHMLLKLVYFKYLDKYKKIVNLILDLQLCRLFRVFEDLTF